jgi:hypothetical protein
VGIVGKGDIGMSIKKTFFYLMILFGLSYVTSCAPPAQPTNPPAQHADPFYNINDNDYPLLHLPLIKPFEAKREDGRSPWGILLFYGPWVSMPNSQEVYFYTIKELEKIAVENGIIMAYSSYVDQDADVYIRDNYYHWFVIVPAQELTKGFHTEDEFLQYIQALGIQDPDWQTPDEAYKKFAQTGCLEWIPDCSQK